MSLFPLLTTTHCLLLLLLLNTSLVLAGKYTCTGEGDESCDNDNSIAKPTVKALLALPSKEIQSFLSGIYERTAWAPETLLDMPSITTVSDLAHAMKSVIDDAPYETKLELLRLHPDLNQKIEQLKLLTPESQEEQSGLESLTPEEEKRFNQLNAAYKTKFGFPFILAVRNASKYTVLAALEGRVQHTMEVEFVTALSQVHKIAWMRLLAKIDTSDANGYLTCHVLDTANGIPAARMRITLRRLSHPGAGMIGTYMTNHDGRLENGPALLGGTEFLVGEYEWTFHVADYFASVGTRTSGQPFLDTVPLRFGIDNPDDHYHVPLLVSPWSYSTYRGS